MTRYFSLLAIVLFVVVAIPTIGGCDKPGAPDAIAPKKAAPLPDDVMLPKAPEGAKGVAAVKKSVKIGDDVVIRGRVGGRKDPFVAERAMLTLIDPSLKSCAEGAGDHCPTPWDYCCETQATIAANSATIQVLDPEGNARRTGLKGFHGIEPLAMLVVKGNVARGSDEKTLIVSATGIYVEGK